MSETRSLCLSMTVQSLSQPTSSNNKRRRGGSNAASSNGEATMHVDEKETKPAGTPTEPVSEPLNFAYLESEPLSKEEADEIFVNAVSEIPTQPLSKRRTREEIHALILLYVLVLFFIAGSLIGILTYPSVTIDLVPMSKRVSVLTQLSIPTRTLPPATLSKSLTATTTGKGYQVARRATGNLTFYNGLFTQQTLPIGTVFIGRSGVKVSTDETVTLPAATPPQFAEATVSAHALQPGAAGNIQAGDVNATVSNGVLVKNTSAFHGGRDARDFQAVSQSDLDILTAQLQQLLTQALPHLFLLRSGEALQTTNCIFRDTPNHQIGEEAREVTVNASETCEAIAYNQDELTKRAIVAFNMTIPGVNYELVGNVTTSIVNLSPLTVSLHGLWVYHVSQDDEHYLAEHVQGDTPAQARAYLLKTGFVSHVTITPTQSLPDPYHIKFQVLISL